eukprot:Hpha_TRINITY_DN19240_c0_g1::TRINITY_DN19240_c0_g1_i1::g.194377::m.194377
MLSWVKDVVRSDLKEFASVVKQDTSALIDKKGDAGPDGRSRDGAGAGPSRAAPPPGVTVPPAVLETFESNPSTYLTPLDAADPEVAAWFRTKGWTTEAVETALDRTAVQRKFDCIVPAELSAEDFWLRYFYRLDQLQREEERRVLLTAIESSGGAAELEDWDDDGGGGDPTPPAAAGQTPAAEGTAGEDEAEVLREENMTLKRRVAELAEEVDRLRAERDAAIAERDAAVAASDAAVAAGDAAVAATDSRPAVGTATTPPTDDGGIADWE